MQGVRSKACHPPWLPPLREGWGRPPHQRNGLLRAPKSPLLGMCEYSQDIQIQEPGREATNGPPRVPWAVEIISAVPEAKGHEAGHKFFGLATRAGTWTALSWLGDDI